MSVNSHPIVSQTINVVDLANIKKEQEDTEPSSPPDYTSIYSHIPLTNPFTTQGYKKFEYFIESDISVGGFGSQAKTFKLTNHNTLQETLYSIIMLLTHLVERVGKLEVEVPNASKYPIKISTNSEGMGSILSYETQQASVWTQ